MSRCLFLAAFLLVAAPLFGQSEEERRLMELDKGCLEAREAKLRPIQDQKIEECVSATPGPREPQRTREACERYWRTYGWGGAVSGEGVVQPRLFDDLPECVAAAQGWARRGK